MTGIHRIEVTLAGSRPPIRRRIRAPASIKLSEMHWVSKGDGLSRAGHASIRCRHRGCSMADERRMTLNKVVEGVKAKLHDVDDFWDS